MIEAVRTPDGSISFRLNGCLLSSRIDPRKEAQEWLESRRDLLLNVRTIIVLGLGSGYQIQELLLNTSANILVIEFHKALVSAFHENPARAEVIQDPRVSVAVISNLRELRQDSQVRQAIRGSFTVLETPAAVNLNKEFYKGTRDILLGRQWGALTWQWQFRSSIALEENPRVEASDQPLTIFDFEKTQLMQSTKGKEHMLVRALRELVK